MMLLNNNVHFLKKNKLDPCFRPQLASTLEGGVLLLASFTGNNTSPTSRTESAWLWRNSVLQYDLN